MKRTLAVGLLAVAALVAAAVAIRAQSTGPGQATREIQITAKKYDFSPDTIEIAAGTRVVFKVTAVDREHGFEIAGAKSGCVKIKKGETATVEYLAEKAGTYEFKCCVFCGMGHGSMKGKIVVR
jgi:cytochrome c oxidase subunit 2